MKKRDYYEVLGISKNADEKTIKRAYRKLAKKYHPDTNQGNQSAEQKFKEITEAYEILSDPEKRKLYDQFGFAAFDGSMGENGANGDFRSWNGDRGGFSGGWNGTGRTYSGSWKSGDGSFSGRWYQSGDGNFSGGWSQDGGFSRNWKQGRSGNDSEDWHRGMFDDLFGDFFGGNQQEFEKNRKGSRGNRDREAELTVSFEEAALGGTKTIRISGARDQSLEVRIPAGIEEGQTIRLRGKGEPGAAGMPAGDLLLRIHIAPKAGYERKGLDLYTTEAIPYTTAVLGGTAVFHTLYGDVKCQIRPGTQSGSRIRLRQKGIVSMKDPSVRGDAYVTIQIAVPKQVTPEEKKKLQELEKLRYRSAG